MRTDDGLSPRVIGNRTPYPAFEHENLKSHATVSGNVRYAKYRKEFTPFSRKMTPSDGITINCRELKMHLAKRDDGAKLFQRFSARI